VLTVKANPYAEGRQCFLEGKPEVCPYPVKSPNRKSWWTGFLDAKYAAKYGKQ
jgi:hypothetical protein